MGLPVKLRNVTCFHVIYHMAITCVSHDGIHVINPCDTHVTHVINKDHMGHVTWLLHECHMGVTWMSHGCHMGIT